MCTMMGLVSSFFVINRKLVCIYVSAVVSSHYTFFVFQYQFWAILKLKSAVMRQDGPKKDVKSLKAPQNIICKRCEIIFGKQYFSSLGGSQDGSRRASRLQKNRGPNNDLNILLFRPIMGAIRGQKWNLQFTTNSINTLQKIRAARSFKGL